MLSLWEVPTLRLLDSLSHLSSTWSRQHCRSSENPRTTCDSLHSLSRLMSIRLAGWTFCWLPLRHELPARTDRAGVDSTVNAVTVLMLLALLHIPSHGDDQLADRPRGAKRCRSVSGDRRFRSSAVLLQTSQASAPRSRSFVCPELFACAGLTPRGPAGPVFVQIVLVNLHTVPGPIEWSRLPRRAPTPDPR